jgi:hypothetical protein
MFVRYSWILELPLRKISSRCVNVAWNVLYKAMNKHLLLGSQLVSYSYADLL